MPDLIKGRKVYSKTVKLRRLLWDLVWTLLVRWLPHYCGLGWMRMWLRLFGAKIHATAKVYPSVSVFMPWNLVMGEYSTIGAHCRLYNPAPIVLGDACVVSEHATLCTASHDIQSPRHEQIERPITLGNRSWVAAEAFIGMGVTLGEGAVVGARAVVFRDVAPWTVVGGNPAVLIKKREIRE